MTVIQIDSFVFRLEGASYQELLLPKQRLWIEEIELGLGIWRGTYEEVTGLWLRWFDENNQWIPIPAEQAITERQRAERLAEYLRSQGIDPHNLPPDVRE